VTRLAAGVEARLDRFRRRAVTEPFPTLESFAAALYDAIYPLTELDGQTGWHLAKFAGALGEMFQPVADVARDTPEGPGWSAVLDLQRCPDEWLPWLAQFVGVALLAGSSPDDMRERIAGTDGFKRGTPESIRVATQATLTGTRHVTLRERDSNSADPPYTLEVVTLTGETPDPAATRAAILAQKPGGIVLAYRTVAGQDWQGVTAKTWRQARATYATWRDLRDNVGILNADIST
jgi:hypothetical protein